MPASIANRPVSVRVCPDLIVVVAEGQIVCAHRRIFARSHDHKGATVYDWRDYLSVIQYEPGALRNGAPFSELPPDFRLLQHRMLKTLVGDREKVEILGLVLQHDEQDMLTAVEFALQAGALTKTHILNVLHWLINAKPVVAPEVQAPKALMLTTEHRPISSVMTLCSNPGRGVMRNNPAAGDIVIMLRSKKSIAQVLSELTKQAYPDFKAALPILSKLLYTETAD